MKFGKYIILFLSLALSLAALGCDKKDSEAPANAEKSAEAKPEAQAIDEAAKPAEKAPEKLAKIEVAATGTKFDPPVEREQIPEGAWYCDMGTVHWASMEKPEDGRCPECHMMLKELGATAAGEGDEEHDHAH